MNRLRFWWRYVRRQTPWDTQIVPPEVVALVNRLPAGRALDIGCGTGTSSLYLAEHGWQVTGIDFVPAAIQEARRKAQTRRQPIDFYVADATHLDFLHDPFDLAIDVGCLHSLSIAQQRLYAAELARLTRSGALYALYAFAPRSLGGRRVGLSAEEVTERFGGNFTVIDRVQGLDQYAGPASAWYTLQRR